VVDFDALLNGPVEDALGEAFTYLAQGATAPLPFTGVWFNGYDAPADGLPPPFQLSRPHVGLRLAQLLAPAAPAVAVPWTDARDSQGDPVTRTATGQAYVVTSGQPDGTGWANLELQLAPT
jgi:hypothetical protein